MDMLQLIELPDMLDPYQSSDPCQSITYIGIGTANQVDQQYPKVIRRAKTLDPALRINLILIDPNIPTDIPPICLQSINGYPDQEYTNLYHTPDHIHVYVFNQTVTYLPQLIAVEPIHGLDITPILTILNQLSASRGDLLMVHDFSGMEIDLLATYFDSMIDPQHILYDLSCRSGQPYQIDFNHLMIINQTWRLFNPFMIDHHLLKETYQQSSDEVVRRQIILCAQYRKRMFLELYLHNYRKAKLWASTIETKKNYSDQTDQIIGSSTWY